MDINSSSDEYSLSPLLFKLDLEDEEELPASPILPGINHLFDQPKYQQVKLPLVKNLMDVTPSNGLWTINCEGAMAMLTKAIDIHGKNYPEQFYQMCMSLRHPDDTDWLAPPYEDWTPSQCKWDETQPSTTASTTLVDSKEEGEDTQVGFLDAWPSPPPSPIHGSSMRPPNIELSGENPGKPWIFNTIGSPDFFRILIPDPAMLCQQILAPWIKYNLEDKAQPEIAGTFGKNYPIIIQSLRPTPVDYLCPVLTPSQLQILDAKQPCGEVVDWILVEHCPKDLLAGVLTYRHYQEAKYTTQCQINALQERHMHYLEKHMEALSSLENANILGCILAHVEDFKGYPQAYANFFKHAAPFRSHITYSSTNTAIDCYMSGVIALGPPALACTPPCMKPTPIGPHSTKSKCCHKCRQLGHIRHECTQDKKKHFFCSCK